MKKLGVDFYSGDNVVQTARNLLGKIIVTDFSGAFTAARIVETEAYVALVDKASHSFGGRRTTRNEHMYGPAGISYVYICYGMHHLFNVVTNRQGIPDAVLIRAAEPLQGIEIMQERTGKAAGDSGITKGPGNVSKALGISKIHSGITLTGKELYLAGDNFYLPPSIIGVSKRIGVDSAGADAAKPYRFYIRGNKYVSGSPAR